MAISRNPMPPPVMPPGEAWPMPPKRRLPSIPPASPPANPCIKGLRPKKPPDGWPGVPREGFLPGVPSPGELGDGLDGILGAEKLRLPRLPEEPPLPALAQALDSTNVETPKKNRTESAKPAISFFLISNVSPYQVKPYRTSIRGASPIRNRKFPEGTISSFVCDAHIAFGDALFDKRAEYGRRVSPCSRLHGSGAEPQPIAPLFCPVHLDQARCLCTWSNSRFRFPVYLQSTNQRYIRDIAFCVTSMIVASKVYVHSLPICGPASRLFWCRLRIHPLSRALRLNKNKVGAPRLTLFF
jgi:hypothetical protein